MSTAIRPRSFAAMHAAVALFTLGLTSPVRIAAAGHADGGGRFRNRRRRGKWKGWMQSQRDRGQR